MKPVLGSLLSWPVDQLVTWTWQAKRSQTSHHLCLSSLNIISLLCGVRHKSMLIRTAAVSHHIQSFQVMTDIYCSPPCCLVLVWPVFIQYFVKSRIALHFCSPSECAVSLMRALNHWLSLQTVNTSLCSFVLRSSHQAALPFLLLCLLFMSLSSESCCITSTLLAAAASAQPLATSSFVRPFLKGERGESESLSSTSYRERGVTLYQERVCECQSHLKMRMIGVEE